MNKNNNVRTIKEMGNALRGLFRSKYDCRMPSGVTRVEGRFLGFIGDHQEEGVISSDLVKHFQLKKSTVSETLSSLERKGFIYFERSKKDARKKGIVLADKGIEHEKNAAPIIAEFDAILDSVLTPEEQEAFDAACQKLLSAIEEKEKE